jgi:hypothetical protein
MQKLAVDFGALTRLRAVMDDDARDLVNQLCTRIGMIMEDASELALTIAGVDRAGRPERLTQLADASTRIAALLRAAMAIDN